MKQEFHLESQFVNQLVLTTPIDLYSYQKLCL